MNDYYSVRVEADPCSQDITDLAAAYLADAGFDSFVPDASGLTAYIRDEGRDGAEVAREALFDFPIPVSFSFSSDLVKGEDWNEVWEKNYFKPILIDGRCVIHSTFHTDVPKAEFDIVIDPKMAFGTGHHDTTSQMVRHILRLQLEGRRVIDMGTGTGILAILAAMRGAVAVGIEIDEPAYLNAVENARLNGVDVRLIHGDASALEGLDKADVLFANINRNIILGDIDRYAAALAPGGTMLLSGFYEEDIPMILDAARPLGLELEEALVSEAKWAALRLKKQDAS